MRIEEINNAGGIRRKRIDIVYKDPKGNPRDAASGFLKLVKVNKVQVVNGPFYAGEVLAGAPEAERSKIVLISWPATSNNITQVGDHIFRVCLTNQEQAGTTLSFAKFGHGAIQPRQWLAFFRLSQAKFRPTGWVKIFVGVETAIDVAFFALLATVLLGKS